MAESKDKKVPAKENTTKKEVLARAKRIQAAKKNADAKKSAEERKQRIARRAEAKKSKDAKELLDEKISSDDEFVEMAVSERKYKTLLTKKYKARKVWVNPNPNHIQSFIPGTIITIDVEEGKVVEEGTGIITLEAMKMQNKIEMPFTARIKKINIEVGDQIPKDFLMVELETVK